MSAHFGQAALRQADVATRSGALRCKIWALLGLQHLDPHLYSDDGFMWQKN